VDVLTQYVRHDDHKFDYIDNIAVRKHIIADRIRYIGKESNNLDETQIRGVEDDDYIEYENLEVFKKWILTLKPNEVRDKGISEKGLRNFKQKNQKWKGTEKRLKIAKTLSELY
jgi:hypothetical protein